MTVPEETHGPSAENPAPQAGEPPQPETVEPEATPAEPPAAAQTPGPQMTSPEPPPEPFESTPAEPEAAPAVQPPEPEMAAPEPFELEAVWPPPDEPAAGPHEASPAAETSRPAVTTPGSAGPPPTRPEAGPTGPTAPQAPSPDSRRTILAAAILVSLCVVITLVGVFLFSTRALPAIQSFAQARLKRTPAAAVTARPGETGSPTAEGSSTAQGRSTAQSTGKTTPQPGSQTEVPIEPTEALPTLISTAAPTVYPGPGGPVPGSAYPNPVFPKQNTAYPQPGTQAAVQASQPTNPPAVQPTPSATAVIPATSAPTITIAPSPTAPAAKAPATQVIAPPQPAATATAVATTTSPPAPTLPAGAPALPTTNPSNWVTACSLKTAVIYTAPGAGQAQLSQFAKGACVSFDGRSADGLWLHLAGMQADGRPTGWVEAAGFTAKAGFSGLPVLP